MDRALMDEAEIIKAFHSGAHNMLAGAGETDIDLTERT